MKKVLKCFSVLLIVLMVLLLVFAVLMAFSLSSCKFGKELDDYVNTKWVCEQLNISFIVDNEGYAYGEVVDKNKVTHTIRAATTVEDGFSIDELPKYAGSGYGEQLVFGSSYSIDSSGERLVVKDITASDKLNLGGMTEVVFIGTKLNETVTHTE